MSYRWVPSSTGDSLPFDAVIAGHDADGSEIYVGRALHESGHIPVKVLPSRQEAYLANDGEEIPVYNYEVLTGSGFTWVGSANGHTPNGALEVGRLPNGEHLFVGRAKFQGSLTPGKIHPSHRCLYIPFGRAEHSISQYEVLVSAPQHHRQWVRCLAGAPIPFGAVAAGSEVDGSPLFVGRSLHKGEMLPAKVTHERAYVPYGGGEHAKHDFEVLTGGNYSWVKSGHGAPVPPNAISTGFTSSGEPLYVGRTLHNGHLIPGKVQLSNGKLYLPFGGNEVEFGNYEVLIGN